MLKINYLLTAYDASILFDIIAERGITSLNIIFDFGNVLVDFLPVDYLGRQFSDKSIVNKLNEIIFRSPEWLIMDQGLLTHEEAIEIFCAREPDYRNEIRKAIKNSNNILLRINDTIGLIPRIKKAGHGLYYLSNMQKELRDHLLESHEYINEFDGGVFSCDVNIIKPSPEIYRYLINKYDLIPEECVFFDDVEANVAAAEKEGIKGILFTTAECVLEYI